MNSRRHFPLHLFSPPRGVLVLFHHSSHSPHVARRYKFLSSYLPCCCIKPFWSGCSSRSSRSSIWVLWLWVNGWGGLSRSPVSEALGLKQKSRILRQGSNPISGSRKNQASSPWAKQQCLACSIMEKPHTGLDECMRILTSCFRARNSTPYQRSPSRSNKQRYTPSLNLSGALSIPTGHVRPTILQ